MTSHATFGAYRIPTRDNLVLVEPTTTTTTTTLSANKEGSHRRRHHPKSTTTKTNDEKDSGVKEKEQAVVVEICAPILTYRSTKQLIYVVSDEKEMRGDAAIHMKLFSHTRFSGVESLDKTDEKYVERTISSGLSSLMLYDLLGYYKKRCEEEHIRLGAKPVTFTVTDHFYDEKIIEEKMRELAHEMNYGEIDESLYEEVHTKAMKLTEKASIIYTITISNFDTQRYKNSILSFKHMREEGLHAISHHTRASSPHLDAQNSAIITNNNNKKKNGSSSSSSNVSLFEPLLFNSRRTWHRYMKTTNDFLETYCRNFLVTPDNFKCLYRPAEEAISNLQLAQYVSEFGKLPVYAYFSSHEPYFREYPDEETRQRELRRYAFDERTERYFLMLLRSSLRRHGLSEASFIRCIEEHFSPENTATTLSPHFLIAEEVVADVGTFAANTAYYTADYRFMNMSNTFEGHTAARHKHANLRDARLCALCGKELRAKVINLDSWDSDILNNVSMCDDCEGQDKVATAVIRSFSIGRFAANFTWSEPALRAVQKLLAHSSIIDVGALVTSAFYDTNNKVLETRQEELPLIGSDMDKRSRNDGHCFGLFQSLTHSIEMFARGNTHVSVIERMRAANSISDAFLKRDAKRKLLVLEPTGSIEPRVLSLEESYSARYAGMDCGVVGDLLYEKKLAEWRFLRHMKMRMKEEKVAEGVAALFVGEGVTHYERKQDEKRRVSPFYNSIVHGSSVDMMKRFDETLSQFAVCKRVSDEDRYGVRTGEFVRNNPALNLSFICPYNEYKRKWQKDVVPMVESIQNQMPVAKFGRYSDDEYAREVYSRYVHPSAISANFDFAAADGAADPRRLYFESAMESVERLDSNRTIVRLYSRIWKLTQDKANTQALVNLIGTMPGLIDHAYYVEKHLPVCEPVVVILCIIDVQVALSLKTTATATATTTTKNTHTDK